MAVDRLFIAGGQANIITEANVQGAPALAVEVLSPGTRQRDEKVKRRLFDERGVREYWIVDPRVERVTVFRRAADGAFPQAARLERSATHPVALETPVWPGWSLAINDLFAEA